MHASELAARRGSERLGNIAPLSFTRSHRRTHRRLAQNHKPRETSAQLLQRILKVRRASWEKSELQRLRKAGKLSKDNKWKASYPKPKCHVQRPFRSYRTVGSVGWEQVGFSKNGRPFPSKAYTDRGVKLLRPGNLFADGSVRWTEGNTRYLPKRWERENTDFIVGANALIINLTLNH